MRRSPRMPRPQRTLGGRSLQHHGVIRAPAAISPAAPAPNDLRHSADRCPCPCRLVVCRWRTLADSAVSALGDWWCAARAARCLARMSAAPVDGENRPGEETSASRCRVVACATSAGLADRPDHEARHTCAPTLRTRPRWPTSPGPGRRASWCGLWPARARWGAPTRSSRGRATRWRRRARARRGAGGREPHQPPDFGSPANSLSRVPWLCVPGSPRVCLFGPAAWLGRLSPPASTLAAGPTHGQPTKPSGLRRVLRASRFRRRSHPIGWGLASLGVSDSMLTGAICDSPRSLRVECGTLSRRSFPVRRRG